MTAPKKGKGKTQQPRPPKPPIHNPAKQLRNWWRIAGSFVLTALALFGGFDLLHTQYENTKPEFSLGESDSFSASSPSLPFTIRNPSSYLRMKHLYLDCTGRITYRQGSFKITVGSASFDVSPDRNLLGHVLFENDSPSPQPDPEITLPFGDPKHGSAGISDMTSEPADLEPQQLRPFPCGRLLQVVAQGNPIISADMRVRAHYITNLYWHFHRAADSDIFYCAWNNGKFRCKEGQDIALDFP